MDTPANNEPSDYEKIARDLWNKAYGGDDCRGDMHEPLLVDIGGKGFCVAWAIRVPDDNEEGCWTVDYRMTNELSESCDGYGCPYSERPIDAWRLAAKMIARCVGKYAKASSKEADENLRSAKKFASEARTLARLAKRGLAQVDAADRKIERAAAADRSRAKGGVA